MPALMFMGAILLYPLLFSFIKSFFEWDLTVESTRFLGLGNYINVLERPETAQVFANQFIYAASTLIIETCLGMGIALFLNRKTRGLGIIRTLLLIPPMIAPAVVGFNFRFMMSQQNGVINQILHLLGIPAVPWLSSADWVVPSIILIDVWEFTPLMVLLFIAGLKSLPQEPMEAALVDGASAWQTFWLVTLPLMQPVLAVALVIRTIDVFRTFDIVWLTTGGGPGDASKLLSVEAYNLAFQSVQFGQASALSYLSLFATLLVLGLMFGLPRLRGMMRQRR